MPNNLLPAQAAHRPGVLREARDADSAGGRKRIGAVPAELSYNRAREPEPPGSTLAKPAHRPDLLREGRV